VVNQPESEADRSPQPSVEVGGAVPPLPYVCMACTGKLKLCHVNIIFIFSVKSRFYCQLVAAGNVSHL